MSYARCMEKHEDDAVGSRVIMDLPSPKLGLLRVEGELILEGLEAIEVAVWVGNTGWRAVEGPVLMSFSMVLLYIVSVLCRL